MQSDYRIGDIIRKARWEKGIDREELCDGICDISTLARIERNKRTPTRFILDAFSERLGIAKDQYFPFSSGEEFEIHNLQIEIICEFLNGRNLDKVKQLLKQLEKFEKSKTHLIKQFILRYRSLVYREAMTKEERKEILMEALALTMPDANPIKLRCRLLSVEEGKILVNMASIFHLEGDTETAIKILYHVYSVLELYGWKSSCNATLSVMVMHNLSRYLLLKEEWEEGLALAEKGIEVCLRADKITTMGELLANKAYALCSLGKMDEGISVYKKALCLMEVLGHEKNVTAVCKNAKERLGISLEDRI